MRVIELSNHPGDMLHDASLRRQATQNRSWWSRLRLIFTAWLRRRSGSGQQSPETSETHLEAKIRAGIAGEQLVATELGRTLGDDWTLLRGYRNRRGEIDHLLLGPRGLFAIEVKNLNATVDVEGERWAAQEDHN